MLKIKKVSFAYPKGDARVLDNVSLILEPGKVVGLVGGCEYIIAMKMYNVHIDFNNT
jgi:ABC-type transporter Mla maintaining outer membrane lipid asymmetry ATPase subunit MlaF